MTEAGKQEELLIGGSYEILRQRLLGLEEQLGKKLSLLNEKRKKIFGSTELKLTGEDRITTVNNCIPRDIISAGGLLIFGYNVFIGLRSAMTVSDVLSVHKFDGKNLSAGECVAFSDPAFVRDFSDLYRYYKKACFLQFLKLNGHLLLIFQTGDTVNDVKVFRFALDVSGGLKYMDDRGEQEYILPPQHSFQWKKTTQDNQVPGKHPHVNIEDTLFVECIEGDLTIKVENNTDTGDGIYSEPVDNKDQALGDAFIHYAVLEGLILLKIKPFGEEQWRFFVFNPNFSSVRRIDSIQQACVPLPEGQGFIFPRGCYQQDGDISEFDADTEGMQFLECVRSPNGEDFLYVFYNTSQGRHILFTYNLISKELAPPVICHGYSLFDDGCMVIFSDPDGEARRIHPMQIWQTPFYGDGYLPPAESSGFLSLVGNRSLVRGISEGYAISRLLRKENTTLALYQEIIRDARKMLDSFHWLANQECESLEKTITEIRGTAIAAVGEYEKVLNIRAEHNRRLQEHQEAIGALRTQVATATSSDDIDVFVQQLDRIRACRGAAITLRELKYIDKEQIAEGEKVLQALAEQVSNSCMDRLLAEDGLVPYSSALENIEGTLQKLSLLAECKPVQEELDGVANKLDLLTATVNNLNIQDATRSAEIIERITELYSVVNRLRAALVNKSRELGSAEAKIEFSAQFKLLSQSVSNQIGLADTGTKCDELLTATLVTLEELEGKFSDYEDFLEQLSAKRDEIVSAFNSRKEQLNAARQRRVEHLRSTALRILSGIQARTAALKDADSLNASFVTDGMAVKFADCVAAIRELGETVAADDLEGKIQSARDEAIRRQRDKEEIFQDNGNAVIFGGRRFNVNTQPFDLATVVRDGRLYVHLTGTDLYELVEEGELAAYSDIWELELPSETSRVARCEFLAYDIFRNARTGDRAPSMDELDKALEAGTLEEIVKPEAAHRYDEGYERGVHDYDATLLLASLMKCYGECGLLRYSPEARACAMIFWSNWASAELKENLQTRLRSHWERGRLFKDNSISKHYVEEIKEYLAEFTQVCKLSFSTVVLSQAGEFLYYALESESRPDFPASREAAQDVAQFRQTLHLKNLEESFRKVLEALKNSTANLLSLVYSWAESFLTEHGEFSVGRSWEMSAFILGGNIPSAAKISTSVVVENLRESHNNVKHGKLQYKLDEFLLRLEEHRTVILPRFHAFRQQRNEYLEQRRNELRLWEFKAKTMGAFVRNRLVNDVYLKFVGDNFAKQMGAAEAGRRIDQMGLLLLISPPGYGKTTLMEYVAATMGLAFMRINGPAIGNRVLSLDPKEAPNATSRQEVEKLNLAFAMGNNVMIYLDDIQHLNPEFLQKFISLCDAQRKIEGVYGGITRTFDLRGKKVAVVMAGNPYTESGAIFKVPDMLANRADTYNLGDISSTNQDAFALSFLENAVTSNSTLSVWNKQWGDMVDLPNLLLAAERGTMEGISFQHSYSPAELEDLVKVAGHLLRIREIVLAVNKQYIASAAQQDEYRTEPPFKLQGSYRNMNRMAEKVFPIMTAAEVDGIIQDHYRNEAQTLTAGAENNLLKFKELMGNMNENESLRWEEIKGEFNRRQSLGAVDEGSDMGKVLSQLSAFSASLLQIRNSLERGFVLAGEKIGGAMAEHGIPKLNVDLSPLVTALENQHLDLRPVAEALQNQRLDLTPLVTALENQHLDLQPLVTAIQEQKPDFSSLAEVLSGIGNKELKAVLPPEYGKAWERQVLILESLVPVISNYGDLQDTLNTLQKWLQSNVK